MRSKHEVLVSIFIHAKIDFSRYWPRIRIRNKVLSTLQHVHISTYRKGRNSKARLSNRDCQRNVPERLRNDGSPLEYISGIYRHNKYHIQKRDIRLSLRIIRVAVHAEISIGRIKGRRPSIATFRAMTTESRSIKLELN